MRMRLKNIKARILIIHLIVTLSYPMVKAFISEKKLLVFCDTLTIVAGILVLMGVFYSLALHGDFDIAAFSLKRGVSRQDQPITYETYRKNQQQKREAAFNYPLFLGLAYLAVSALLAYTLL